MGLVVCGLTRFLSSILAHPSILTMEVAVAHGHELILLTLEVLLIYQLSCHVQSLFAGAIFHSW